MRIRADLDEGSSRTVARWAQWRQRQGGHKGPHKPSGARLLSTHTIAPSMCGLLFGILSLVSPDTLVWREAPAARNAWATHMRTSAEAASMKPKKGSGILVRHPGGGCSGREGELGCGGRQCKRHCDPKTSLCPHACQERSYTRGWLLCNANHQLA